MFTRQAAENGVDIVAAYGGDGTMMEVARGVMGLETLLAIFPGGTANLMAVDLGIPKDLSKAADMVVDEHLAIHSIDLGRSGTGYFLLRVGMGFLARKVVYAARKLKDRFGVMAYTLAALEAIKSRNVAKLLDVSSFEAARSRDFDLTEFGSPREGWQPPYPYHWKDVSFVLVNV